MPCIVTPLRSTQASPSRVTSSVAAVTRKVCSIDENDCHQPEFEIWSRSRNDDTRSPTVGISQTSTRTKTVILVAQASDDLEPAILSMTPLPQLISRRAWRMFQTMTGVTISMMMKATAVARPSSRNRYDIM